MTGWETRAPFYQTRWPHRRLRCSPGTVIVVYAAEVDNPVVPTRRCMTAGVPVHYVLQYGVPALELGGAVADVAAAQDAVEAGAVGKVLVVPGPSR